MIGRVVNAGLRSNKSIYDKCKSLGTTPSSLSSKDINTAVQTIYNNRYNDGMTAADNRVNTSSINYTSGFEAGVAAGKAVNIGTGSGTATFNVPAGLTADDFIVEVTSGSISTSRATDGVPGASSNSTYTLSKTYTETGDGATLSVKAIINISMTTEGTSGTSKNLSYTVWNISGK